MHIQRKNVHERWKAPKDKNETVRQITKKQGTCITCDLPNPKKASANPRNNSQDTNSKRGQITVRQDQSRAQERRHQDCHVAKEHLRLLLSRRGPAHLRCFRVRVHDLVLARLAPSSMWRPTCGGRQASPGYSAPGETGGANARGVAILGFFHLQSSRHDKKMGSPEACSALVP